MKNRDRYKNLEMYHQSIFRVCQGCTSGLRDDKHQNDTVVYAGISNAAAEPDSQSVSKSGGSKRHH